MKIFIENLRPNMSPYNGKGKFVQRLAAAITGLGHQVVDRPEQCNINFRMNALPSTTHGKRVVRLDSIAYTNDVMHRKIENNKALRSAIKAADGIVYQSQVARQLCEGVLDIVHRNTAVIGNGIQRKGFSPTTIELPGRKNFVFACQFLHHMRRTNRLLEAWEQFVAYKDDAWLHIVYGENMTETRLEGHKNVQLHSILKQPELNNLTHSCDAALLLTYQDACPNYAAEALACNTPIITNNTNGICEYINTSCGWVLNIDGGHTFERAQWSDPPFVNGHELVQALERVYQQPRQQVDFPQALEIETVAGHYLEFFKSLTA